MNPRTSFLRLARVALFALLPFVARAQQDPMYSMYMWNLMTIMPGYAGSNDVLNVTAVSRAQWTSIQGAPVTHALSAHAPVNKRGLSAGLSVVNDKIGRLNTTSIFTDVAYRIKLDRKTRLSFGMKMGMNQFTMNNTQVENTDPNDPLFASNRVGAWTPNFGFGLFLHSKKSYIGVSVPKILRNYLGSNTTEGERQTFGREATHVFITGGHVIQLGTVKFKPTFLLKVSEGSAISTDLSANFLFMDKVWVGAAYRIKDAVTAITSLRITDQFRVGYAYDMGMSRLGTRLRSSHEVMISYDPVFTRERVRSPRYF